MTSTKSALSALNAANPQRAGKNAAPRAQARLTRPAKHDCNTAGVRALRLGGLDVLRSRALLKDRFAEGSKALGPPVLKLDFLLETLVQREKPLDWAAFWRAQPSQPLKVVASGLRTRRALRLGTNRGWWVALTGCPTTSRFQQTWYSAMCHMITK